LPNYPFFVFFMVIFCFFLQMLHAAWLVL
jgi:hypothetical protein